ncbi:MAG: cation:proton antiporter [Dermatophilaceae bacterium]
MDLALTLTVIAMTVIIVARLCEQIELPAPLGLLGVGVIASFVPGVPTLSLSPDLVLFGLLPPLLYAAALNTSLIDIRANIGPILGLSVGLVLFTALGVALVASALLPISFPLAFALGAIVAPPDAVAATAVARQIGLPRRITTILEGESLLNDATALVALRTALAAAGLAIAHAGADAHVEQVSAASVAQDFAIAAFGGAATGWLVFVVTGFIRKVLVETAADTALSFAVPFVAYVAAEKVHASGVIAVVVAGLFLGHQAPVLQSAPSRLSERVNWASITFLLENAVFLLIGLQMASILDSVRAGDLTLGRSVLVGCAVLAACLILRPLWMLPFTYASARSSGDASDRMRAGVIGSWAGMRGVVTLAAALTLPDNTPYRPMLVLVALIVTVGTLVLQGFSLPWLCRVLDVRGPDPREDALVEATVVGAAAGAGLRAIEADPDTDPGVLATLKSQSAARVNRIWERLGSQQSETPSETYRRTRLTMIAAERAELLRMRSTAAVDQHVLTAVLNSMDAEEAALTWGAHRAARVRETPLRPPDAVTAACAHLQAEAHCVVPDTPDGCPACLAEGLTWVHLRMCTECGHVGCCDSSPGKHASAHFHDSGHPVMRSLEPGEAWRWCFVDEALG